MGEATTASATDVLAQFVPARQLRFTRGLFRGEEGQFFRDKLADLARTWAAMPVLYGQEGKGEDATVFLHYFGGSADWWITEKGDGPDNPEAFGLADLFGDGGELGYISIAELLGENVELDYHWTPKTLAQVRAARAGH